MLQYDGLWILGFGGHARSVADIALACGIKKLLFIDEAAKYGEQFMGFDVLSIVPNELPKGWAVFPAAGDNTKRKNQYEMAKQNKWPLATLIAPSASLGVGSSIQPGTLVAHHAHIGPMAVIGSACIINTGAIVEHESRIGDYCHISVHSTIAGRSQIGASSFIGAGSTVIDGLEICENVTLGAGSCAITNILTSGIYVGVPARGL